MQGKTHCRTNNKNNTEWCDYYCESRPIRSSEDIRRFEVDIYLGFIRREFSVNGKFPWEEAEEEPTGGGPTMVAFKEGDRVKHKRTGLHGEVVHIYEASGGVLVHWEGTGRQTRVLNTSLDLAGQVEESDDSGSFISAAAAAVGDTMDEVVETAMSEDGPTKKKTILAAVCLIVVGVLQCYAANMFGPCDTGEQGAFDATQKPCRLSTDGMIGLPIDYWSYGIMFVATIMWQNTPIVLEGEEVMGRRITRDALWRIVHLLFTIKCIVECCRSGFNDWWFPLTLSALILKVALPEKGAGPSNGEEYSSEGVDVYHPAFFAPARNWVTALQLVCLLSLSSLADRHSIMACIVAFWYVYVTGCNAFWRTVVNRVPNVATVAEKLGGKFCDVKDRAEMALEPALADDDGISVAKVVLNSMKELLQQAKEASQQAQEERKQAQEERQSHRFEVLFKSVLVGVTMSLALSPQVHVFFGAELSDSLCRPIFVNDQTNSPGLLSESSLSGMAVDGSCQMLERIPGFAPETSFSVNNPDASMMFTFVVWVVGSIMLCCVASRHPYTGLASWWLGYFVVGNFVPNLVQVLGGAPSAWFALVCDFTWLCWVRIVVIAFRLV